MTTPPNQKRTLKTEYPSQADRQAHPAYHLVFIALVVLTAAEVGASYLPGSVKVPLLIVFALTKALLVILYFMHLRYDNPIFASPLIAGVILAIPIILIIVVVMPIVARSHGF